MEKVNYRPISPALHPLKSKLGTKQTEFSNPSFAEQLNSIAGRNQDTLIISKHAKARLADRNIEIDKAGWTKIGAKVKEAKKMGVTESLVLTKNAALIVSAKNNTVITAMDRKEAGSQIFTNINGTIIMD
ncbi:TIGR02530 family flagellar biosynthesis protein [Peribacillus sp. SCS-37]|uniref:TIGR02530 family flagellar biosynthesis protein n=1 Tax=Paraperibacillus esterisolvens TaxID=3115296 RepID=UPI003906881A